MDSQLDFDSSAVRFRPNESGIDQTHFVETFKFLQAQRQELARFECCGNPDSGRLEITFAVSAKMNMHLLWDSFSNVNFVANAVDTHVCSIGRSWYTTSWALQ